MGNLKIIKSRIEGVSSTKQITNAMKMVAASKLRKAQENIESARPYARAVGNMLGILKMKNRSSTHPFFIKQNKSGKTALFVVTSDRGLCGSFNSEIIKKVKKKLDKNKNIDVICIGSKSVNALKKTIKIYKQFTGLFNTMNFSVAKEITELILDLYLNKNYSKIEIIYNGFVSVLQQENIHKKLFPIEPVEDSSVSRTDFLYDASEESIIDELGKKFIAVEIWRILLESSASEQAARMTAMDNATENATEIIEKLSLLYNRQRQAAITAEILDIVGGAEAING